MRAIRPPDWRYFFLTWRVAVVEWLVVPLDAEIVNVDVPRGVLALVLIVKVTDADVVLEDKLTLVGLNDAVVLAGSPATVNDPTVPVNPFVPATVTVVCTCLPRLTDRALGETLSAKSPVAGLLITRVTLVECTSVPLVPVIVIGKLPVGVPDVVVTVIVAVPEELRLLGLKLAVVLAGRPLALRLTADPSAPEMPTVTV